MINTTNIGTTELMGIMNKITHSQTLTLRIPPHLYKLLMLASHNTNLTMSEVIRQGLQIYLETNQVFLPEDE